MQRPWRLEESGLLYTRRTSGRFVTENQDMIRAVKSRLVREHTRDFLNKMGRLGFTHPEITAVSSLMEENKNE